MEQSELWIVYIKIRSHMNYSGDFVANVRFYDDSVNYKYKDRKRGLSEVETKEIGLKIRYRLILLKQEKECDLQWV